MKILLFITVLWLAGCATQPTGIEIQTPAAQPYGWPEFCQRYPAECQEPK